MGSWSIERKLRKNAARLRSLRDELRVLDEQLPYVSDDASDAELRALVSERPLGGEPREAREHADAMTKHRARMVAEICDLEQRQDDLLDRMNTR